MNACTVWRQLRIGAGTREDYQLLAMFHYRAGPVVAVTRVLAARHKNERLAGVLVESFPGLNCAMRNRALARRYAGADKRLVAETLNAEMRTIARVIVHPAFRGIGLAEALVRQALATAQTEYVEARAAMGRVHPFFRRAGMAEYARPRDEAEERLVAALEAEGMRALDLADAARIRRTPGVEREMRRLTRRAGRDWEALVAAARQRVLSRPVYYLWRKSEARRQKSEDAC
jgi:predicted GNAT family acetyltransferase